LASCKGHASVEKRKNRKRGRKEMSQGIQKKKNERKV
jgi:hypothetical protein